jgi:light-regulated signal transduction histidine kinase (bacteriophytochrome)
MAGWGWQSVHDPDGLPEVMKKWTAAIATGLPFEMEFPMRGADGSFRNFLTRVVPTIDADGRVTHWFGTNTDVEALRQAEKKVHRLNAELEERVASRTEQLQIANDELEAFSYSVSHDLRAPLRHVLGFAELLLKNSGPSLSEKGLHQLTMISEAATHMGQLIDELLAFSRISKSPMEKKEVNLEALVQEVLADFASESKDRNIAWKTHSLPSVRADRALLRQVLVNLISNAMKFTGRCAEAKIEIGCAPGADGETVIFIRDNGAGFDPEYADKLFGVFQRLHSQAEFEGTGIGLANVQRIIHRHDGRTWAEGAVDRGATFYFSLPDANGATGEH